jgi:hypothetical protein
MQKWWLAIAVGALILSAVIFRYNIISLDNSSSAYMLDRWTGHVWVLRGNFKIPVGAPPK